MTWDYARYAHEFFTGQNIRFWEARNANDLVGKAENDTSKYCLAAPGDVFLVYLADGGSTELDLSGVAGDLQVQWFNPRTGGNLEDGSVRRVAGGGKVPLGEAPTDKIDDWLVVVRP